jgi:hypothetical protein
MHRTSGLRAANSGYRYEHHAEVFSKGHSMFAVSSGLANTGVNAALKAGKEIEVSHF